MKTFNITTRTSKQAKVEINRILATHERYRRSFFFTPATDAGTRRRNEKTFSNKNKDVSFITKKGVIHVTMQYRESCRNVYYSIYIMFDGVSKNITTIKNLLK